MSKPASFAAVDRWNARFDAKLNAKGIIRVRISYLLFGPDFNGYQQNCAPYSTVLDRTDDLDALDEETKSIANLPENELLAYWISLVLIGK